MRERKARLLPYPHISQNHDPSWIISLSYLPRHKIQGRHPQIFLTTSARNHKVLLQKTGVEQSTFTGGERSRTQILPRANSSSKILPQIFCKCIINMQVLPSKTQNLEIVLWYREITNFSFLSPWISMVLNPQVCRSGCVYDWLE